MFCPICGECLDEHERKEYGILYTCPKGCFEEDHPLVKQPGPGKRFTLIYFAGLPPW